MTKRTHLQIEKSMSDLDDLIALALSPGNADHSPYLHGMANGMLLAHHVVTDSDEDIHSLYVDAPKRWGCEKDHIAKFEDTKYGKIFNWFMFIGIAIVAGYGGYLYFTDQIIAQ